MGCRRGQQRVGRDLAIGRADVNQDVYGNMTALHAVAQGGSTNPPGDPAAYRQTAELLIRHGADINRRADGDRGQTPLDDAIRAGNEAVVKVLTGLGAVEASR